MKYVIENKKINEILDELGEEYKDCLIENALFQSREYDVNEIKISTLIQIDERIKDSLIVDNRKRKRDRLLNMMSVLGIIYAIFGLCVLIYYEFSNSLYIGEMLKLSIISVTLGLAVLSFSVWLKKISLPYKKGSDSDYYNYEIVNKWKKLEGLLVQLTPSEVNNSFSGMVSNLSELGLLSNQDVQSIKAFLALRNQIVHSNRIGTQYSTKEIKELLSEIDTIIRKLQKFENN